jgi:hypothetical protein
MKAKGFLLRATLFVASWPLRPLLALQPRQKEKAPELVLTTFDNKIISLSDFQGRPVLVKFFASW